MERNVQDGTFGEFVAEIDVPGELTSVIWGDEGALEGFGVQ